MDNKKTASKLTVKRIVLGTIIAIVAIIALTYTAAFIDSRHTQTENFNETQMVVNTEIPDTVQPVNS